MDSSKFDALATINMVLNSTYTNLDSVPIKSLRRVYTILRIMQIMDEHNITMPQVKKQ